MGEQAVEELAFYHVIDKLAGQQIYVTSLRNQAGISAAITGLVGTVFGTLLSGRADLFKGDFFLGFSMWALLAISLFCASIAFSAVVVIHFRDFTFSFDASKMLQNGKEIADRKKLLEKYVEDGEWYFRDNEDQIYDAQTKLWFAVVLGVLQIIPCLILVRSTE